MQNNLYIKNVAASTTQLYVLAQSYIKKKKKKLS
jgi:hypothetical protein